VIGTFILGATTLRDFGMALFIGLVTGAYSSVFIASPVLSWLKEREPRYRQLRARLEQRGGPGIALLSPAGAARAGLAGSGSGKARMSPAAVAGSGPAKARRPAGAKGTAKQGLGPKAQVLRPGGSPGPTGDPATVTPDPIGPDATEAPVSPVPKGGAKARRPTPPVYKKVKRTKR